MNNMIDFKMSKFMNTVLACLWIYQGLIPKILFIQPDEILIWQLMGFNDFHAKIACYLAGISEMIFGILWIRLNHKIFHFINIFSLTILLVLIAFLQPKLLVAAFNPVVMNVAMISLSLLYLKYGVSKPVS